MTHICRSDGNDDHSLLDILVRVCKTAAPLLVCFTFFIFLVTFFFFFFVLLLLLRLFLVPSFSFLCRFCVRMRVWEEKRREGVVVGSLIRSLFLLLIFLRTCILAKEIPCEDAADCPRGQYCCSCVCHASDTPIGGR